MQFDWYVTQVKVITIPVYKTSGYNDSRYVDIQISDSRQND
jgi:hypothetical protein